MSKIRLGAISLDCADPGQLIAFWAELLGGEIVATSEEVAVVKLDNLLLTTMRVDDYVAPTWPKGPVAKQSHMDLDVDDLAETEKRAVSLAVVRAEFQQAEDRFLVFFDPAGHPFCLSTIFPK